MNRESWMVHRDERGIILVMSLLILLAMTALGMAVFYSSTVDFKIAGNERSSRVAYYAAQAGLLDAKKRLEANTPETTGYDEYGSPDAAGWVPAGKHLLDPGWQLPSGPITGALPNGASYEVSITHVGLHNGTAYYVKRGLESDWWPYYRVTSTGTYLDSKKTLEEHTYLNVVDTWTKAVIACGDLEVANNGGTDSFDSDTDIYNSTDAGTDGDIFVDGTVSLQNNSAFKGSIIASGPISMKKGSIIDGGLTSGDTIMVEKNTIVTGDITSSSDALPAIIVNSPGDHMPGLVTTSGSVSDSGGRIAIANITVGVTLAEVKSPEACNPDEWLEVKAGKTSNSNNEMSRDLLGNTACQDSWDLCVEGGCCTLCPNGVTVTLPGGTENNPKRYYFEGLSTDMNVTLITNGPGYVEVYVEGDMEIVNNATFCGNVDAGECYVNTTPGGYHYPDSHAEQILLYGFGQSRDAACVQTGTDSTVIVDNNVHLFGKIYAPDASMTIIDNNAEVYGAVVAGGMCAGCLGGVNQNAKVHYDAAIANTTARNASTRVANRKECFYGTLSGTPDEAGEYYAIGACAINATSP
jgi:hypothetical protein